MRIFILFLLCLFLSPVKSQENKVYMDFSGGVELKILLEWYSQLTGKSIVYGDRSGIENKKVYFIAPDPIPEKSVEKVFMSLLESNGFTLIRSGRGQTSIYKLISTSEASTKPVEIYSAEELAKIEDGDYYISQLMHIKHLKTANILSSLRQAKLLDPRTSNLVEIKGANALIITDFLPNVKRIVRIIEMLDKAPPKTEVVVISLQHATATDISQKLSQVFQNRARELADYHIQGGNPTIIPDVRTNTLTIRGITEDIRELTKLVKEFDRPIQEDEVVVQVYTLKHAPADKILPTLKSLVGTAAFQVKKSDSTATENASIIADEHSRNLIITAPRIIHEKIQQILPSLDIRRPQVLLEAVICEFTPSDVLNLGIELMQLDNISDADRNPYLHGITSFGLSSVVDEEGDPITEGTEIPQGRVPGAGSGLLTFLTKDRADNIPVLLRALQSVTHTEVISLPRILADDGEEAEIRVEQEEPVTSTDALNTSTTTTSFKEFVSAGTVLRIRPQVIQKDWLRLEIEQNIESFVGAPPAAGIPPPKSSRSLRTVVTVPNKHTVILGGLTGRREVETVDKIPVLGDIPLLGFFFQSRSVSVTKTNLYIFISPQILRDANFQVLEKISAEEYKNIEKVRNKLKAPESKDE